jgi:C4-dicarboxylate-specific signal transduction histidine kinase
VENSSDVIWVADLKGMTPYLNPSGRRVIGIEAMVAIRPLSMLDFVARSERKRLIDECLPVVVSTGRWQGEVHLRNFKTEDLIPTLTDPFLIKDRRPARPAVMATISRDLTMQTRSEARLRRLSETLELEVLARTNELIEANEHLRTEAAARRLANERLQELQSESLHAARHSTAGQVAGALAHELGHPLGAAINYLNTARRLLGNHGGENIERARAVMDEAAAHVLRGGRIIERVRAKSDQRGLRLTAQQDSPDTVCIMLADSGQGVPRSLEGRLFQPFATLKRNGMGLGLAISRSIIEAHGGLLWHERQPRWGAALPVAGGEASDQ